MALTTVSLRTRLFQTCLNRITKKLQASCSSVICRQVTTETGTMPQVTEEVADAPARRREVYYENFLTMHGRVQTPCRPNYGRDGITGCDFTLVPEDGGDDSHRRYVVYAKSVHLAVFLLNSINVGHNVTVRGAITPRIREPKSFSIRCSKLRITSNEEHSENDDSNNKEDTAEKY